MSIQKFFAPKKIDRSNLIIRIGFRDSERRGRSPPYRGAFGKGLRLCHGDMAQKAIKQVNA